MSKRVLGRCSLCNGLVTCPTVYMSVLPPVPTCESCGAQQEMPVIAMANPRVDPQRKLVTDMIQSKRERAKLLMDAADELEKDTLERIFEHDTYRIGPITPDEITQLGREMHVEFQKILKDVAAEGAQLDRISEEKTSKK